MRYRLAVTDFAHEHSLTHLSATEARLSARAVAAAGASRSAASSALTALGWLALGLMSSDDRR